MSPGPLVEPQRRSRHQTVPSTTKSLPAPPPVNYTLQYYSVYPRKMSSPNVASTAPVESQVTAPGRPMYRRKFSNDDLLYSRQSLTSTFAAGINRSPPTPSQPSSIRSSRTLTVEEGCYFGDSDLVSALAYRLSFIINSRRSISGPCQRISQDSTWTTDSSTVSHGHGHSFSGPSSVRRLSGYFGQPISHTASAAPLVSSATSARHSSSPHPLPVQVAGYLADLDKCLTVAKLRERAPTATPPPTATDGPATTPALPLPSPRTEVPMPEGAARKVVPVGPVLPTIPPELQEALARAPVEAVPPTPYLERGSTLRHKTMSSVMSLTQHSNQSSSSSLHGDGRLSPSASNHSLRSPAASTHDAPSIHSGIEGIGAVPTAGAATPGVPVRKSERHLFSLLRKASAAGTHEATARLTPSYADLSPTFRAPAVTPNNRDITMVSANHSRKSTAQSSLSPPLSQPSVEEPASPAESPVVTPGAAPRTSRRGTSQNTDHALEHQVTLRDVVPSSVHAGWLSKLTVMSSSFFSRKSWKRRYFVLAGSALYRFKAANPDALSSETLGLTPESIVCLSDAFQGRQWVLEVTSLNIGTWFIQAQNREDMKEWMTALKSVVGRIQYGGNQAPGLPPPPSAIAMFRQLSPASSPSEAAAGDQSPEAGGSDDEAIAEELKENPLTPESVRGLLNSNLGSLSVVLDPGTNRRMSQSSGSSAAVVSPRQSWTTGPSSKAPSVNGSVAAGRPSRILTGGPSLDLYGMPSPGFHMPLYHAPGFVGTPALTATPQSLYLAPPAATPSPPVGIRPTTTGSYMDALGYKHPLPTPAYTSAPSFSATPVYAHQPLPPLPGAASDGGHRGSSPSTPTTRAPNGQALPSMVYGPLPATPTTHIGSGLPSLPEDVTGVTGS
ncbi:hypothetical protein IWQ60_008219 [Tieghemiomyces parasiticus]|uniref:PH domain-containing protein n=1 Tax=Tieghemiomyces parasiticus TaxID=78921 RepID=A0A9W7ZZQ4_9FUNG|nr:hypothetical protein IWQ60_008219 [Tieghemiomyces parasiticus]